MRRAFSSRSRSPRRRPIVLWPRATCSMLSSTSERATLCAMLVDDGYLIERLRTGENLAFEELVEHHAAPLLAVTRRILRDEEEARDAVQETFVAAFRNIGEFNSESRGSTWLERIAVKCALSQLRTPARP